jgi:hypothetical protein
MNSRTWMLAGSAVALVLAPAVYAQEAPAQADRIEDVIVTAAKREERALEAPQAITALGAEDLSRLDATQFRDFAAMVPALSFTPGAAPAGSERGLGDGADGRKERRFGYRPPPAGRSVRLLILVVATIVAALMLKAVADLVLAYAVQAGDIGRATQPPIPPEIHGTAH